MMRLTKVPDRDNPEGILWIVEGRIHGEYVQVLREEYRGLSAEERSSTCIDLEQVTFVDDEGIEVLREMEKNRVRLQGARGFVREVLRHRVQDREAASGPD